MCSFEMRVGETAHSDEAGEACLLLRMLACASALVFLSTPPPSVLAGWLACASHEGAPTIGRTAAPPPGHKEEQ